MITEWKEKKIRHYLTIHFIRIQSKACQLKMFILERQTFLTMRKKNILIPKIYVVRQEGNFRIFSHRVTLLRTGLGTFKNSADAFAFHQRLHCKFQM